MLVMGPGGYRFGDYWRLGLPLTMLVAVARHLADRAVLADALACPNPAEARRWAVASAASRD